jgi:hypothetical protein
VPLSNPNHLLFSGLVKIWHSKKSRRNKKTKRLDNKEWLRRQLRPNHFSIFSAQLMFLKLIQILSKPRKNKWN